MRLGIMSDSHGNLSMARMAINSMGTVDLLVHLGDYCHDAKILAAELQRDIIYVKGNCDFSSDVPNEKLLDIEGLKIYITHGHQQGVKWGHDGIVQKGRSLGADIVLFGHSHVSEIFLDGSILFMNPGSVGEPRGGYEATCGIIEIKNGKPYPYILSINI